MSEHTPGPWELTHHPEDACDCWAIHASDAPRLEVEGLDERTARFALGHTCVYSNIHDARLIASSPDLYEACMRCVEHMEWSTPQGESAYAAARVALAKARGETS